MTKLKEPELQMARLLDLAAHRNGRRPGNVKTEATFNRPAGAAIS